MNKEKAMKTSWYIFLAAMAVLTILFFLDIKFVVLGLNILVLDMLTAGIWAFVRLCRWAGRENTGRRTAAVIAITLVGLFASFIIFIGLCVYVGVYVEQTEPQTHRTFVAEYAQNMMGRGSVKLYERFGPLLLACDVDEYVGEFSLERPEDRQIYISEDGKSIVVAYFFHVPIFIIPLEPSAEPVKTPQQELLEEQLVDDTHDAFLIDTGGDLGTLLITAELDEEAPTDTCRATVQFAVWNPDDMGEPLQTIMAGTDIFRSWSVIDANFDGYMDFTCTYLQGNQPSYDHLWIWDEYYRRFNSVPEYDKISMPTLDEETETIYGFNRSSGSGTGEYTFYQWVERKLVCMRQIDIYGIVQSDTVRMSVWDRVAGELAEIYHEDFPSESGGWLDAEMIWHDLDYHGEPGGIYDIFQQQTVDDTHDAFLVSTGGELGTLLITAELAGQSKDEFGTRDITFSVWNLAEMERPIQTFSEEVMMGVAPEFHHTVDANFDGFQDFGYLFHAGNQPYYRHYWLWDEEQRQFQYCAPLVYISQPGFDPERQVITGWARSSGAGDGVNTFHRWEDGELVCVRWIESHDPWEEPSTVSVMDRINGELQRVYYEEFPWSGEEPEGREAWRQARYQWCDLDYHGES